MGFLDPKSRILDVVLTNVGREALARNNLKIAYYSLTDGSSFYETDISGSSDVTSRVYAEASSDMPQDVISLLTNDAGQLTRVRSAVLTGSVYGGHLLQGTYEDSRVLTGSAFASTAGFILSSSLENLRSNFLLGTVDELFEDFEFRAGPSRIEFAITNTDDATRTANVTALESFFQDPLFSHVKNFQYLPPINKQTSIDNPPTKLGDYTALGGNMTMDFGNVKEEMALAARERRVRTVMFDPAPRTNNIHLQFFEQTYESMSKLDVLDFGTYRDTDGTPVRVLFVGKVYWDDYDSETFVRLFTVTLE
jgi:hypothetical protein